MNFLEERICQEGIIVSPNVLKVDSFLNHQMDTKLFEQMANAWKDYFKEKKINKILTIEASGIGIACIAGLVFNVPVVFAKKSPSINVTGDVYRVDVESFTHQRYNPVFVSKRFLSEEDHVLIIDDFLANGAALLGLTQICKMAGAKVEGIGIAIEKGFQPGGKTIRSFGYDLKSLAIIESMNEQTGEIVFCKS